MGNTGNHVIAKEVSGNAKLGGMSTTYASLSSCPKSCRFLKTKSCYGDCGYVSYIRNRLERAGETTPLAVAKEEAAAIDELSGKLPLRLHTIGDCATEAAAKLVASAAERFMARHNEKAYTYTHAWRSVPREAWGTVSVLASCETAKDIEESKKKGYATSVVLSHFHELKPYWLTEEIKVIPCPKQAGTAESCLACGLCMRDQWLRNDDVTIAFKAHGPTLKAKDMLAKVNK